MKTSEILIHHIHPRIQQWTVDDEHPSANLIELNSLAKEFKNLISSPDAQKLFPAVNTNIQKFPDQNASEWRDLWSAFIKKQKKKSTLTNFFKAALPRISNKSAYQNESHTAF